MINLRNAFIQALKLENISQREFARNRGIKHANLNKFIKSSNSVAADIKAVIFVGWQNPDIQKLLFEAHILDEMIGSKVTEDLEIQVKCKKDEDNIPIK